MNISEEKIDSFLRGDLNGAELDSFKQVLHSDPKLQQEVSFQQDIVDSIKKYRHNQLKNRLNSIEISPISAGLTTSPYFKLAASIGIVALLVGTFAIITNTNSQEKITSSNTATSKSKEEAISDNAKQISSTSDAISSEQNAAMDKTAVKNTQVKPTASIQDKKTDVKITTNTASSQTNQVSTHSNLPSDEEMTSDDMAFDSRTEDFSIPTVNNTDHSNISASVVKVNIVKEKNLAYRYFNNELYLHGNFSNSTYELFELNNKPSKQLFLYFENNYYELIQGKTKVTNLVPITDKATLAQLAQLREH